MANDINKNVKQCSLAIMYANESIVYNGITDPEQLNANVLATVAGEPANGAYCFTDGSVLNFANGYYVNTVALPLSKRLKIMAKIKPLTVKAEYTRQDATGVEILFPKLDKYAIPNEGDFATIDGEPASGEFLLPNGGKYKFVKGVLTDITAPMQAAAKLKTDPVTEDRTAGIRAYLEGKKPKPNPHATPDNRYAGLLDHYKQSKRKHN